MNRVIGSRWHRVCSLAHASAGVPRWMGMCASEQTGGCARLNLMPPEMTQSRCCLETKDYS